MENTTMETTPPPIQEILELARQQHSLIERLVDIAERDSLLAAGANENIWVKAETASQALGNAISAGKIRKDLRGGFFKEGLHYIRTSNDACSGPGHYGFKLSELRKFYETPPEKRRKHR
jgi:hypothetical protein